MIVNKEAVVKFVNELRTDLAKANPKVDLRFLDVAVEKIVLSETGEFNLCNLMGTLMLGYAGYAIESVRQELMDQMSKVTNKEVVRE